MQLGLAQSRFRLLNDQHLQVRINRIFPIWYEDLDHALNSQQRNAGILLSDCSRYWAEPIWQASDFFLHTKALRLNEDFAGEFEKLDKALLHDAILNQVTC
jgi:hypothetical protein